MYHQNLSLGYLQMCALYRQIKTVEDATALQQDFDGLQKWEKDRLMEVYPQKCQIPHINNKRKPIRKNI